MKLPTKVDFLSSQFLTMLPRVCSHAVTGNFSAHVTHLVRSHLPHYFKKRK